MAIPPKTNGVDPIRTGRFSQAAYEHHGGMIYETPAGERVLVTCSCGRSSSAGCCRWEDIQDVGPVTSFREKSFPSDEAREEFERSRGRFIRLPYGFNRGGWGRGW